MKSITVNQDEITKDISSSYDFKFDGTTFFSAPKIPTIERELYIENGFSIGLIVGPSGSGKSTLLSEFGTEEEVTWDTKKAVASHFCTSVEAQEKLSAVGFNTIPSWLRPYHVLSTGEKFRADLARRLQSNAVIDEFTSVVDRNVAKSCSVAIRRYVDKYNLQNVVLASCHYDIIEWLQPDWVFDTISGSVTTRGSLRRPEIILEILPCSTNAWEIFRDHHYLSGDINKSSRCWIAVWNDIPIGFSANLALPSGTVKNAWKGHRTVILPDFQGMGLGIRMSEAIGDIFILDGKRYFTKTAHPRLGEYRESSSKWIGTTHNLKSRNDYLGNNNDIKFSKILKDKHFSRLCYAHEYVGTDKIAID